MNSRKKRILLTDDDHILQELIQIYLEASGYDMVTACNGREAAEAVQTQSFDLILLDLMMPVMDGREFLHWLRDEEKCNTPVIVLTAMHGADITKDLLESGATVVNYKPLKPDLLLESVNTLLQ